MAAVWARARAELRSGWRRGIGLALLIGLVGGAAIAAAAGARRTDSALDRFNHTHQAADVLILDDGSVGRPGSALGPDPYHPAKDADRIATLQPVVTMARARYTYALGNDGVFAPADASLGRLVDRHKLLHGREPRPDRAEEVVVSFDNAKRNRLRVGSTFPVIDPSYADAQALVIEHPDAQLRLRVVGVAAVPGALPPYQPGTLGVWGTPALYRFLAAHEEVSAAQGHHPVQATPDSLIVRLRQGQADVPAFRRALQGMAGDKPVAMITADFLDGNPRRSMHVQAQALWLLCGLLVFSAVLVFGQTLSRFIAVESAEAADLRALGMTVSQLWGVVILRMAVLAVAAGAVAVITAVAVSPLAPLGLARTIEPAPGISVDGSALALGFGGVVVFVLLLSIYPAWRAARASAAEAGTERASLVAGGFARAGLPPSIVAGTRMALESGRGRTSVPVRSTVLGATIGVAALAAALTFGTSLARLLQTPRLYGVAWDTRMTNYGAAGEDPDVADLSHQVGVVARQLGVAAVSAAVVGHGELAGRDTGLMSVYGALRPPMLGGRYPTGPDDIALGAKTMRRLRAHLGSMIVVNGPSGQKLPFRVVGKTVLPADADPRLGEGMLLSRAGIQRAVDGSGLTDSADSLLIRFAPGVDPDATVDRVQRALGAAGPLDVLPPQKPTDLVNFGGVKGLPFVLAGILAVVAVATLAHLLVSAVRHRRRDLAILKTLGFSRGQITRAVFWQGTVLAAIALLVGIPLGVGVGRWLWTWFASQQGVVSQPRVPIGAIVLVVPAAIVLAGLVAAVPARIASLIKPALVLRTE